MKSMLLITATLMLGLSAQAQNFGFGDNEQNRGGFGRGDDFDRGGRDDRGRDDRGGWPGRGDDFGRGREETRFVTCESQNKQAKTCAVDGDILDVVVSRQLSNSACIEGSTYGTSRNSIWVSNGCRAEFRLTVRTGGGGHGGGGRPNPPPFPPPSRPTTETVRCESRNYRQAVCQTSGRISNLQVQRQRSNSACIPGQSYGYTGSQIWVTNGCAADFAVSH